MARTLSRAELLAHVAKFQRLLDDPEFRSTDRVCLLCENIYDEHARRQHALYCLCDYEDYDR